MTQTTTAYHGNADVEFALQPPYFQLPKQVTEQWRMRHDSTRQRSEVREYGYDDAGNQTLEVQANGVRTVSEYYQPGDNEEDCPPDPHGFVRHLKNRTVYPSPGFEAQPPAPILRTNYRYGRHGSVLPSRQRTLRRKVGEYWLQPKQEMLIELPANACTLVAAEGQLARQTEVDVKGVATRAELDGMSRVVKTERHDADAQDEKRKVEFRTNYTADYDVFGNLVKEVQFDWMDEIDPDNPDGPVTRITLELPKTIKYDGWNQQYAEIGADGVMIVERTDLIGSSPSAQAVAVDSPRKEPRHANGPHPGQALADGPQALRTSWKQTPDGKIKGGKTMQWLNTFDHPIEVQRVDTKGKRISRHRYFYDGLGRSVREIDARGATERSVYDVFDRVVDKVLADGSTVHREYAQHSGEDLPTSIAVDGKLLGEQRFDGLDRMIESTTGGRKRVMHYLPGHRQASWVITPRNARIDYVYQPQLGEEPTQRRVSNSELNFRYNPFNARLEECIENGQTVLERDYFSTGKMKVEKRTVREDEPEAKTYIMQYHYSLLGRELAYVDVLGATQLYKYDTKGRLISTELGTTQAQFEYDELGRTKSYVTTDGAQRLGTFLIYDDFDREIERRFELQDEVQVLEQLYDAADALTERHLKTGDGATLRLENYWYDARARLEDYECRGELSPVDHYGKVISAQHFTFDELDNIKHLDTWSPDGTGGEEKDSVEYLFSNPLDPVQLTGITRAGTTVELHYDPDGNLTTDEQGRTLTYNALGQLERVDLPDGEYALYAYDPLDRLASQGASAVVAPTEKEQATSSD